MVWTQLCTLDDDELQGLLAVDDASGGSHSSRAPLVSTDSEPEDVGHARRVHRALTPASTWQRTRRILVGAATLACGIVVVRIGSPLLNSARATAAVSSSVRLQGGVSAAHSICNDTAYWANGWSACAYEDGGKDATLCRPTAYAKWPSTRGWTCKAYREKGWCGVPAKAMQFTGPSHQSPEKNCCVCGGGSLVTHLTKLPSQTCHTALPGEFCYTSVHFAMRTGIHTHPEWYPSDFTADQTSFEDFQNHLHEENATVCPKACPMPPVHCHTAEPHEHCYAAVKWAMSDGVKAHPDWYPGLDKHSSFADYQVLLSKYRIGNCMAQPCPSRASGGCFTAVPGDECFKAVQAEMNAASSSSSECGSASSFEECQEVVFKKQESVCHQPCKVQYSLSPYTAYRSSRKPKAIRGIVYRPSPYNTSSFMAAAAGAQWAAWGRADIGILVSLGANTVRTYASDPFQSKRSFLDEALKNRMDVVYGGLDSQKIVEGDCVYNNWYCFDKAYSSYKDALMTGLAIRNSTMYHPAVKAVFIIESPDLVISPRNLSCRAIITAMDGMLQAEKDLGVTGNPVAFSVSFNHVVAGAYPGVGQMLELYNCMKNPGAAPTLYTPKNNVGKAYIERFVNSLNTASGKASHDFLKTYAASGFWQGNIKIPVFFSGYRFEAGVIEPSIQNDLVDLLEIATDPDYPFFLGFNYFEFMARPAENGSKESLGIFKLGKCQLATIQFNGSAYPIYRVTEQKTNVGEVIAESVRSAFGGNRKVVTPTSGTTLGIERMDGKCEQVIPMLPENTTFIKALPTYWETPLK